jgi:cell division septal protein FtsQ
MNKSKFDVTSNFLKSPEVLKKEKIIRRKKYHSNFALSIITSLISIFAFFFLIALFFYLGILNVKNYNVSGNSQIATVEIEDFVKKETYNKLILSIDPDSISKKLKDQFTLFYEVRVVKELPSTLNIEVKERSKAVVIKTLENINLVTKDGMVVEEIDGSLIKNGFYNDLTVVSMIEEPRRSVGYVFDTSFIKNISKLITEWKLQNGPAYSDILIDKDKIVRIVLTNGSAIILNLNKGNLGESINDTIVGYKKISQTKTIKTYDVRFDKIVVT